MLRRGRPTSDPHGMGGVWVGGGRRETHRLPGSHVAPKGSGPSTVAGWDVTEGTGRVGMPTKKDRGTVC